MHQAGRSTAPLTLLLLLLPLFAAPAAADTVHMKDGSALEGRVLRQAGEEALLFEGPQGTREIPLSRIARVAPGQAAASRPEGEALPADVAGILKTVEEAKFAPGAGALYLVDEQTVKLNPDGSYRTESHFLGKVLEDRAKGIAFVSLSYDKARESVDVLLARTITPDGRAVDLDPALVTDVESFGGDQFFSRYKTKSFTLPEVTVGSIVEYRIVQHTHKPLFEGYFAPMWYFTNSEPTLRSKFTVILPPGRELNWRYRDRDASPCAPAITKDEAGDTVMVWERRDIPALVDEPQRPPYSEIASFVEGTLFQDWNPIFDWNGDKYFKHIAESSDAVAQAAREATKDAKTEDERIAAIYYWIQKNIRYISIKGDVVAGLAGHPARETFEKKYGDCVDKAVLMSAMLKVVGVECHPIGTMTNDRGEWRTDLPRYFVNHSFVYIRKSDSTEVWLDPTTTNFRYPYFREDDQGVNALVPTLRAFKRTDMPLVVKRAYEKRIKVEADGAIRVDAMNRFAGGMEASYRGFLKNRKPQERQDALARMLNSEMSGTVVEAPFEFPDVEDLATPFTLRQVYRVRDYAQRAKDLLIFKLPGVERAFPELALETRRYAVDYQGISAFRGTCEVEVPEGFEVDSLPAPLSLDSPFFRFAGSYAPTPAGFRYVEDYARLKPRVELPDYDAYRKEARMLQEFSHRKVVLRRKGGEAK